jgi:hypothetical protein
MHPTSLPPTDSSLPGRWAALAVAALLLAVGCGGGGEASGGAASGAADTGFGDCSAAAHYDSTAMQRTADGLQMQDFADGSGPAAETGDSVDVHYTGCLTNGQKFDSSYDRGEPYSFRLGTGSVIPGWDEGLQGMRPGGKRRLVIPADLGYGTRGAGSVIPPNSTLIFDVQLVAVNGSTGAADSTDGSGQAGADSAMDGS